MVVQTTIGHSGRWEPRHKPSKAIRSPTRKGRSKGRSWDREAKFLGKKDSAKTSNQSAEKFLSRQLKRKWLQIRSESLWYQNTDNCDGQPSWTHFSKWVKKRDSRPDKNQPTKMTMIAGSTPLKFSWFTSSSEPPVNKPSSIMKPPTCASAEVLRSRKDTNRKQFHTCHFWKSKFPYFQDYCRNGWCQRGQY